MLTRNPILEPRKPLSGAQLDPAQQRRIRALRRRYARRVARVAIRRL